MHDQRAQALPEVGCQQLRHQHEAAGGHPQRHGDDAAQAHGVVKAEEKGTKSNVVAHNQY